MTNKSQEDDVSETEQSVNETVAGKQDADGEQAIGSDSSEDAPTDKESSGKAHGGRNILLILLLIIVAVGGALAAAGKLTPLWHSLSASMQQPAEKPGTHSEAVVSKAAAPAVKKTEHDKPAQPAQPVRQQPVTQSSSQTTSQPVVPNEQVRSLLANIHRLQGQLQRMSQSQQDLQNGLLDQQQMNLQVRLRWIADPASRLPQIQLAWEEISLLPGLSDAQRSQAVHMHTLARTRVQQLKQWQDALQKWADALATPVHRNILPEPPYPWLAWIVSQFQLRQAPSVEARHLSSLRAKLLDASRRLTLESWPEKGGWQSLQAELLLQIKAMQKDRKEGQHEDQSGDDSGVVETGLPENFDAIQADLETLRQTALAWQQGGEQ